MAIFSRQTKALPHEIVLYTRAGCHLCEDAEAVLGEFGLSPRKVDVDAFPELIAQHGQCVPVVSIDGRIRFRGRVDRLLLRRLLDAPRANPGPTTTETADG